jgi:hypothetical protein
LVESSCDVVVESVLDDGFSSVVVDDDDDAVVEEDDAASGLASNCSSNSRCRSVKCLSDDNRISCARNGSQSSMLPHTLESAPGNEHIGGHVVENLAQVEHPCLEALLARWAAFLPAQTTTHLHRRLECESRLPTPL